MRGDREKEEGKKSEAPKHYTRLPLYGERCIRHGQNKYG